MWERKTTKMGTLDESLTIRAVPGFIEIVSKLEDGGWELHMPADAVDELIERLSRARDAARLMMKGK